MLSECPVPEYVLSSRIPVLTLGSNSGSYNFFSVCLLTCKMKILRVTASYDLCDNKITSLYVVLRVVLVMRRGCNGLVHADIGAMTSFVDVLVCFLLL